MHGPVASPAAAQKEDRMADDPQKRPDDLAMAAMQEIIAAVRRASEQDPTPITDIKLLIGLLETAGSLAALVGIPDGALEMLVNVAFNSATERVERFQAKRRQEKDQPTAATPEPAVAVVTTRTLTDEQVRELLARMKEGGRVH
jgi:hypothetical protein